MSQFTSESQFQAYTANILRKEHMIRFLREMNLWERIESTGQQFHDNIKRNGDNYRLAPLTITLIFDLAQVQNVSGIHMSFKIILVISNDPFFCLQCHFMIS